MASIPAAIPQYRAAYVAGVNHMTITNTKETCYLRIVNVNNVDSDQKITGAQFRLEIKGENASLTCIPNGISVVVRD